MLHGVPICWEKDIKAGYLKFTSIRKFKTYRLLSLEEENYFAIAVLLAIYLLFVCLAFNFSHWLAVKVKSSVLN